MSLPSIVAWILVGSLSAFVLWLVALRGRPLHRVSFITVVGVAFFVAVLFEGVLAFRVKAGLTLSLFIATFPFTWLQCFVANCLVKFVWDQRAKTASTA